MTIETLKAENEKLAKACEDWFQSYRVAYQDFLEANKRIDTAMEYMDFWEKKGKVSAEMGNFFSGLRGILTDPESPKKLSLENHGIPRPLPEVDSANQFECCPHHGDTPLVDGVVCRICGFRWKEDSEPPKPSCEKCEKLKIPESIKGEFHRWRLCLSRKNRIMVDDMGVYHPRVITRTAEEAAFILKILTAAMKEEEDADDK